MRTKTNERRSVRCADCGYGSDSISPADASVAIRSFPRRFRERLAPERVPDHPLVTYRPSPKDWSALENVAHVADGFHVAANRLVRVRVTDQPRLGSDAADTPALPVDDCTKIDAVMARLDAACVRLAGEIDATAPDDWPRVGLRNRQEVSALQLVHEAVHEGAHHLREVERVLQHARRALGRPDPPSDED